MFETNDYVKYAGTSRPQLESLIGKVARIGGNGSVGIRFKDEDSHRWSAFADATNLVWAHSNAWNLVEFPSQESVHQPAIDAINDKIADLKNQLSQLEAAREVLIKL